jgi:primosomal protein N' (replication factor Y)
VTGTPVPTGPAAEQPVARVAVDVPLPHLDRLFDYLVPSSMAEAARPGCRVRVRFSGRLTSGYLVERAATSDHDGSLAFLRRVVSPEPVLSAEIAWLARAVADRYGGTMADVLRLAIPPRHAATEKGSAWPADSAPGAGHDIGGWARYPAGPAFLAAVAAGRAPRAVWSALPGQDWPAEIARAAAAAAGAGRGVVIVVPDTRDLALVDAALTMALGPGAHVSMAASLGPAERYRRWLAVRRGQVRVAAGTRSAMFAPVADLGLVVIWDDGDDLHNEPRAPYPHARDVLLLRAHHGGAAALVGGFTRTAEAAQLLETGWAKQLAADRATVRRYAPLVRAACDDADMRGDVAGRTARLPALAVRTAQAALSTGPVLFQVPRRGYLAAVACQRCRVPRRCGACGGPVALPGRDLPPRCGWCATLADLVCPKCGATEVRALVTGSRRTAEELSRAFPGVPVRVSSGASVLADVPPDPAVVVATPGAEPPAQGGYAAAVLLDGWALLGRASSRAGEEALRRWMNAAALVRPRPHGGTVVVLAEPGVPAVQALIRWDAAAYSERELAERAELRFPPAVRMAALTGPRPALRDLFADAVLPDGAEIVGPVASGEGDVRYLVRAPTEAGGELAISLRAALARRSARKEPGNIRLRLDPAELI